MRFEYSPQRIYNIIIVGQANIIGGEKMSNNIAKYVERLKSEGMTTTEIIEKSGVGRTTFYDIMRGKQIPKIDTAMAISKALQADIKDVFPQLKGEWILIKEIKIDDAYKSKTQEEINEIIRRLEEIASKSYYRQLNEKILKWEADKWMGKTICIYTSPSK